MHPKSQKPDPKPIKCGFKSNHKFISWMLEDITKDKARLSQPAVELTLPKRDCRRDVAEETLPKKCCRALLRR